MISIYFFSDFHHNSVYTVCNAKPAKQVLSKEQCHCTALQAKESISNLFLSCSSINHKHLLLAASEMPLVVIVPLLVCTKMFPNLDFEVALQKWFTWGVQM